MKSKLTLIALFLCIGQVYSQSDTTSSRGITINYSFNNESFEDTRFSFRNRVEPGFTSSLLLFWKKNRSRHSFRLGFGKNFPQRAGELVAFNNLRPEFIYTYQREIANWYVGGYFGLGSLLSFPTGLWAGNNNISYSIWGSVGLATEFQKRLPFNNERFAIFSRLRIPIVSYVIRPSYGLPYPEDFIEDGVFNFQREGMGRYVLSSGNLNSLNTFQKAYFEVGFSSYFAKKRHEIGLSYILDYLKIDEVKEVKQVKNGIQLSTNFKF